MNILVSQLTGGEPQAILTQTSRDEYGKEIDPEVETVICHEPAFHKKEDDYNAGEDVIAAIARTADGDSENPGTALERLVTQVFLLGVAHGTKVERERIVGRLTG